jgi:hypothetical protein
VSLTPRDERILLRLLRARMPSAEPRGPPPAGAQPFGIPRESGGVLAALHFPVERSAGVILLSHGGDRVPWLREQGLAVATFDHGGSGESDPAAGLPHREWADALRWARRRYPGAPVHVWGVGLSAHFAHHALARDEKGVASAIFEDVPAEVGGLVPRMLARGWLPAAAHAPDVNADRVLYLGGRRDLASASPLARHHPDAWDVGGAAARDVVRATLRG